MTITALPSPPSNTDSPSAFASKAAAFVAALPQLRNEINNEITVTMPAIVSTVAGAAETATGTTIPGLVQTVSNKAALALTHDIPDAVALVDAAVAATAAGQATAAKVAAEAAQALAQAAALASAIALAAKDNIAIGRGLVADGQTFWVKPNLTDGLTRFSAYQRTSSTTQTLIVTVGTGAELDALAGLLVTRSNASINGVLAAWLDSYGRAAGMIGTDGRWTISKLTAKNATIDASTFTLPPSLPGYVMGVKSAALSAVTGMLAAELDSYGRIALALRTDGSLQVSKLRDGAGALVYPQIAAIKATADAALAMAAGSGITPGSAKARLQAALAWGNWPRVMSSPPVVTIGVANAASTIAGSALVSASDARLQMLYATKTLAGATYPDNTLYKGVSGHYGSTTFSNGVALEFAHTGAALELYCKGTGNSFRIFVDDRLTQEAAYGPVSNVGALFNIKVEFSSSARRRIRVEGIKSWGGVRLAPGDTLEAQGRDYPLVVALGDSGWEGTGASLPSGGCSFAMGRALGWNMQSSGLGGTGVLAKGLAGVNTNYLDRLSDLTVAGAAMGIVPVSINDLGQNSDGIRDACYQIYDAWAAVNPASPLVFMGPWVPRGTMPSSGIYALDDGIRKAAWALRCPFVDTLYPNPRTGTGSVIATTGDGNADFYSGFAPSDNLHPSQLGHDHFGLFYAARIKQIILDEI